MKKALRKGINSLNDLLMGTSKWKFYLSALIGFLILDFYPYYKSQFIFNYSTSILAGESLPKPVNFASSNLLPALTYRVFNIEPSDTFGQMSPLIYLIFLITLTFLVYFFLILTICKVKSLESKRYLTIIFILLPMHRFLMPPLDVYDIYIYLGISIIFYALSGDKKEKLFLFGVSLFIFTHPEQALASFTAFLILCLSGYFQRFKIYAFKAFSISVLVNSIIYVWYFSFGYKGSRTVEIVFSFFSSTLPQHVSNLQVSLLTIISMYGLLWFFVLLLPIFLTGVKIPKLNYITSVAIMPLSFWLVTSDGLRCVVPLTTLMSLVIGISIFGNNLQSDGKISRLNAVENRPQ
jgi:hypothetical protein